MATSYRMLGQVAPSSTTETPLFSCSPNTSAAISSIIVCNRGSSQGTFRIAVKPSSSAVQNENYIFFDNTLDAKATEILKLGLTVSAGNVIEVYASSANFSFSAFGAELS